MDTLDRETPAKVTSTERQQERRRRQAEEQTRRRAVVEKAHREGFQAGHEEGHSQGYQAGYEEGLAAAQVAAELEFQKRLDLSLGPISGLADAFHRALTTLDEDIGDQLVELALIAGRQLAGESLKASPQQIVVVVKELLDADTSINGKPRLWLHPEDLELVVTSIGETLTAANWECHPDPTLERGGCRVTSASGGLDATLDTQWKAILDQRRQRRRTSSAEDEASDDE